LELADFKQLLAAMSFHPTEGGAVVYDPSEKKLFALNAPAALVWKAIRDGESRLALSRTMAITFDLADDEAEDWIEQALSSFDRTIPVDAVPHSADERPAEFADTLARGTDYVILGQTVRIAAPDAALELIDCIIGHLKQTSPGPVLDNPAISISIEPAGAEFAISGAGDPKAFSGPRQLAAEVEKRIVQELIPRVRHLFAIHAALLEFRDATVLFPGQSGAGKTTLSTSLAAEGWNYLTDEMALFEQSLTWQGLPFRPCIKAESYNLVEPMHPSLHDAIEHDRFGRRVKFLPIAVRCGGVPVSTVVFPEYSAQAEGSLHILAPLEGLQRLLAQCVYVPPGFKSDDVSRLLQWHEQTSYYALKFRSPCEAVRLLYEGETSLGTLEKY
jgi:hypothetical protein